MEKKQNECDLFPGEGMAGRKINDLLQWGAIHSEGDREYSLSFPLENQSCEQLYIVH